MPVISRNRLLTVAKVTFQILGPAILAYLVWANWNDLVELYQREKRWGLLATGFALCLASALITFLRWYLLVWAQSLPFRLRDSMRIGFIGYLYNQIIPGAVGGDLVKAALLAREQERRTVAISTVVIDRIVGMYGLTLLAGLASLVFLRDLSTMPKLQTFGLWVATVVGVGTVAFGLLFTPLLYRATWTRRIERLPVGGGLIREVLGAMDVYHGKQWVVLVSVAMSLFVHMALVSSLFCIATGLGSRPWTVSMHYLVAPIGLCVNAIPLSPGGIGWGEGGMKTLFDWAGVDGVAAVGMMLAYRVTCWLIALGGVPYLLASFVETRRAIAEAVPHEPAAIAPAAAARTD